MKLRNFTWALLGALLVGAAGMTHADQLIGVLPATPGDTDYQAYYDPATNLTWLANANRNGLMTWSQATSWAASLDINGVTGWTLPTTTQPDSSCSYQHAVTGFPTQGFGVNCTGSEMGYLFYDVLGGTAGSPLSSTAPFTNVQSSKVEEVDYWSATESAPYPGAAWRFDFGHGSQTWDGETATHYGWAVHAGDVGSVPEPGSIVLMLAGLAALGFLMMRRRAALKR